MTRFHWGFLGLWLKRKDGRFEGIKISRVRNKTGGRGWNKVELGVLWWLKDQCYQKRLKAKVALLLLLGCGFRVPG